MSKQQEQEKVDEGVRIAVPEFVADKDNPFAGDLLGRGPRVKLLCDFARSVSDHVVIAVDGEWGTGKTAFLRMCRAYLEQQEVRVAEFNAWTESYTTDPVFNLASALAEVVEGDRLTKIIEAAKVIGVAAGKSLPFKVGDVVSEAAEMIAQNQAFPNGLPEYRDCVRGFKEALEQEAARADGPLLVLVDEMDRCLPQQVVEYLGAVHNLLAVPGVVVVLAINLEQTARGLEAVYGSAYGSKRYLQRFFSLRMTLDGAIETDGLLPLIRLLRGHFGDDVESAGSADFIDYLLSIPAMASRGSLRDLQRVGQALQLTAAVGFGQKTGLNTSDQGNLTQLLLVALALLVLSQLDEKLYREFMEGKKSASEVMLGLRNRLPADDRDLPIVARAVAAYLDVLGDALGTPAITEDQYQEVAGRYGLQRGAGGYEDYCRFVDSVRGHLRAGMSRQVLAAVEMANDWPNIHLRA
ncbi:KAP family P-loop NTPase fold protein [Candidatus Poriferisocius sp.]|uniref:KAP family P-loop NTPase fold protein n=1 Tax=Candidatus Poriferisocius sp. TaxID=3101276 RepID=UPI003B5279FC